ncbi:unnamed protein product, partial [Rotaria sp. Silwood2]
MGAADFRALQTLCTVASATVNSILVNFLSSALVMDQIISQDQFDKWMNVILHHLQRTILDAFVQALTVIRITSQGNGLMNISS